MSVIVSTTVQKIFEEAVSDAKKRRHEFVTPEHLLWRILFYPKVLELFTLCGSDLGYIHDSLNEYLGTRIPSTGQNTDEEPIQTIGLQNVFERAILNCNAAEKKVLGLNDIIVSLIDEEKNHCSFFMKQSGINRLRLLQLVGKPDFYDNGETDSLYTRADEENGLPKLSPNEAFIKDLDAAVNAVLNEGVKPERVEGSGRQKRFLERFTVNLTALAREGKLNPVIGRNGEIERTIQILCRKQKNNPIHVGGAGVGKTAVTEGLAQRIAENKVPSFLKEAEIYTLNVSDLTAGAKFRGDFEHRFKKICAELYEEKSAILFIDEIHTVMDANAGGGLEISDLLKPVLTGGRIRCIGATTYEEYNKYFAKDKALVRRFQKIDIEEPSEEETLTILQGLRETYEQFHKVRYSDEVLKAAVRLSNLYIRERLLPDKAIDLIDEAGALLKIRADKDRAAHAADGNGAGSEREAFPEVQVEDIDKITAKTAKIPEQKISESENEKLKRLEESLSKNIFGQDDAVKNLTKAVKRSRAGFRAKEKPAACFLFVGPTGVGKTALAKTVADELGIPLIRFDMSEYQEKHTVSRLIGSPPGYVGFEEGGLLTDAVRKQPNAVLLLDEIEKAHSDIYNLLLQIMDYAVLTDNQGRKANFNNIILIMTSNAGTANIGKPVIGFAGEKVSEAAVDEAVEKTFSAEFRNRLDSTIKFKPLSMQVMHKIVTKETEKIRDMLTEKGLRMELSDDVIPFFAEKSYSAEYGARNAARLIEDEFITPLTDLILFGDAAEGKTVLFSIADKTKQPYVSVRIQDA